MPIELLDPNPNQPRQVMGDLSELMASVAEKGIIEPLIVRQRGSRYQIIAGERRYHAAVPGGPAGSAGDRPRADDAEVMELALVENLQRKDLTAFEEAEAMQQLAQKCRYTHEDMARKLGSRGPSITESLSLEQHAGRGAEPVPAGGHHLEVDAAADRPAGATRRRCWRSSSAGGARAR